MFLCILDASLLGHLSPCCTCIIVHTDTVLLLLLQVVTCREADRWLYDVTGRGFHGAPVPSSRIEVHAPAQFICLVLTRCIPLVWPL